jgi:hypothetical protein
LSARVWNLLISKILLTCCFFIIPGSQGSEQADVGGTVWLLFQTRWSKFNSRELNHFPTTWKRTSVTVFVKLDSIKHTETNRIQVQQSCEQQFISFSCNTEINLRCLNFTTKIQTLNVGDLRLL